MNVYCIDFETLPIESGSSSTPEPVGVSIKFEGNPSCYYDFDDSSTFDVLINVVNEPNNLLVYHNAAFDVRVQLQNMGIPIPPTGRLYDTMIFQYLIDAREDSLGLKELAQKYCGIPNTEQDELQNWLKAHGYNHYEIYKAPYELVKKYAEKDTDMTYALYLYQQKWLNAKTQEQQSYILQAFEREMKLLPVVIDMQMHGVSLTPEIDHVYERLEVQFDDISERLRAYGSGQEPGTKAFFNALVTNGYVDSGMFEYTAKGNVKFGRDVLHKYISDAALLDDLEMRSRLQKLLSTYVRSFARSYAEHNGKFYFWLSQTRGTDDFGTRTGRFSSNIQQIPKEPKDDRLPFVRSFIVAKPGYVLLKRDFSQQELRVAAHYAEGGILQAYKDNPKLDVHSFVQETIKKAAGIQIDRTTIKTISFLKLYRGGARLLAEKFGISYEAAATFFKAYDEGLPEFVKLMRNVEAMAERGEPIRTWGGRYYLPEPPKDGKTYYYKMGNVLIQGSSADMTKEAMNRYYYHPNHKGRLALTVHDELVVEVLEEYMHEEMAILQWAMDEIPGWDVPLASDGFYGYNYGELKEYEQPN